MTCLTSRQPWRLALTLTVTLTALTLTPTASPQLKRTAGNWTSLPTTQASVSSARPPSDAFRQSDTTISTVGMSRPMSLARPPVPHPTSTPPTAVEVMLTHRIETYLHKRGSPMTGIPGFVRDAHLLGINPVAVIAIAEVESSLGKAACRGTKIATGLGACFRAWTVITLCGERYSLRDVHTWRQGLTLTARLLKCLWPGAREVGHLHGYCAGCPYWAGNVASVMARIGSGPGVRWNHAIDAGR